jgi:hypothetical protein
VAFGIQQDVRRLQVAVEDASLVRVMHRPGDFGDEPRRGLRIGGVAGQDLGQARAVDELHAEILPAVVLADLVDRDDSRMVEVGRRLGLVAEGVHLVVVGPVAGPEHPDGDRPIEVPLPGLVDDPHAAAAEDPQQLEVAEVADTRPARELVGRGPGRGVRANGLLRTDNASLRDCPII